MKAVRVKICGVRNLEEAELAVRLGADALGFNFWSPSPRYIAPQTAREIVRALPPFVSCVGVFVNEEPEQVIQIASTVGLAAAQLHGDETAEYCARLGPLKIIKAIRVGQGFDSSRIKEFPVSAVLLDSGARGNYGGTGARFDWQVAIEAKRLAPIIVAGGLTPDNVGDVIITVRPMAVDVCSGVEAEPGRKDPVKLRSFMEAARRANAWLQERTDE